MASTATSTVEKWVEEHSDYLFNYAMSKIGDREQALDLIQDTFVAALQHIDTFRGDSKPRTWLVSILKRKIIDDWRKSSSRKTKVVSDYFVADGDSSAGSWIMEKAPHQTISSVEEQIMQKEQIDDLTSCMETLPEQWKGVLHAKYMQGKKGDIICGEFDINQSNFWVIVHRAKLALRECLETDWKNNLKGER